MDPFAFRQVCGRFATGVTVITALDGEGVPSGMTANSFASVSLDPPLVSAAIDLNASTHAVLLSAPRFAINILAAHQETLSRHFASEQANRFDGVDWHHGLAKQVLLDGALAHIICERWSTVAAGDHTILIGRVIGGDAADHGTPLLYYRGGYASPQFP